MREEMAELSKALLKLRRAQKFREPGQWLLMEDVAEEIAALKGAAAEDVVLQTEENARKLYGL